MKKLFLLFATMLFISASSTSQNQPEKPKKVEPRIVHDISELADCLTELEANTK